MDSEIDAQDMINEMGDGNIFIEGDSDIIDEAAEDLNNSMDQVRRTYMHKKPKSLDDQDGTEEDLQPVMNEDEFFKGLMTDRNLADEDFLRPTRKSIKDADFRRKNSSLIETSSPEKKRNSAKVELDMSRKMKE